MRTIEELLEADPRCYTVAEWKWIARVGNKMAEIWTDSKRVVIEGTTETVLRGDVAIFVDAFREESNPVSGRHHKPTCTCMDCLPYFRNVSAIIAGTRNEAKEDEIGRVKNCATLGCKECRAWTECLLHSKHCGCKKCREPRDVLEASLSVYTLKPFAEDGPIAEAVKRIVENRIPKEDQEFIEALSEKTSVPRAVLYRLRDAIIELRDKI